MSGNEREGYSVKMTRKKKKGVKDMKYDKSSLLTFISCHFSSIERNDPHDFTKSNNVFGGFGTGLYELDVDESDFDGGSATTNVVGSPLFSRGANTVLLPEARNMPPPTRLGLAFSLTCLASLKEFGFDELFVEIAGDEAVGVRGVLPSSEIFWSLSVRSFPVVKVTLLFPEGACVAGNFKGREDTGFNVSVLTFDDAGRTAREDDSTTGDSGDFEGLGEGTTDKVANAAAVDGGSMILIGMRRRLIADEESNEDCIADIGTL